MARSYTVRTLLTTHQWAREHPNGLIPIDRFERLTGDEWLRWFRRKLDEKVSSRIPQYNIGRKWDNNWQWDTRRIAEQVNTPRLIVRWAPKEFRARLQHRLTTHEED